jgi:hypothetical protein
MTNGDDKNQSQDDAKKLADQWVRDNFTKAKDYLNGGNLYWAYYYSGTGLHALQDATSPSHSNFKAWHEGKWREDFIHVFKERNYPGVNSNLQKITDQYLNWFENSHEPLSNKNLFDNIKSD